MIDQRTIHFWSQGIKDVVVGADPIEAAALYDRAYHGSFYHGRRGTFIQAYSAVDIALYDLAGRQLGLPVYKLLGGARTERIRPYATCYPGDIYDGPMSAVLDEITRQAAIAADQGLTAVKVPVLFGAEVPDRASSSLSAPAGAASATTSRSHSTSGTAGGTGTTPLGHCGASKTSTSPLPRHRCATMIWPVMPGWQPCRPCGSAAPSSQRAAGRCASG